MDGQCNPYAESNKQQDEWNKWFATLTDEQRKDWLRRRKFGGDCTHELLEDLTIEINSAIFKDLYERKDNGTN